tara:strand:+ start:1238 stop:1444 length:207 start_codon:yes stop_codon:yes gene_type:complete
MPITHESTTPQHQVLINQSIMKRVEKDIKELKKDIEEIKQAVALQGETLLFIRRYTEIKKSREASKWF